MTLTVAFTTRSDLPAFSSSIVHLAHLLSYSDRKITRAWLPHLVWHICQSEVLRLFLCSHFMIDEDIVEQLLRQLRSGDEAEQEVTAEQIR